MARKRSRWSPMHHKFIRILLDQKQWVFLIDSHEHALEWPGRAGRGLCLSGFWLHFLRIKTTAWLWNVFSGSSHSLPTSKIPYIVFLLLLTLHLSCHFWVSPCSDFSTNICIFFQELHREETFSDCSFILLMPSFHLSNSSARVWGNFWKRVTSWTIPKGQVHQLLLLFWVCGLMQDPVSHGHPTWYI